jgi:predicted GNAT family N-acyltransferase
MGAPKSEIGGDVADAAAQNLAETYLRLGLATPGAAELREPGFRGCLGQYDHPICNFAVNLDLEPWSARRLADLARPREAFNVYILPGDRPGHVAELLERAGFERSYVLRQMAAAPSDVDSNLELHQVSQLQDRHAISQFMADQFFSNQPHLFRRRVVEATAHAEDLELWAYLRDGKPVAALMLSPHAGALGVYNVCVASRQRNRGYGSSLMRWALNEARRRDLPVVLQCDPRLESWYARQGFVGLGELDVRALAKGSYSDIMGNV